MAERARSIRERFEALTDSRKSLYLKRLREQSGALPRSGGRLTAAFAANGSAAPDPAELRQLCERNLPPYMVPQQFVRIDEMPLTPAGKIDRKSLASACWTAPAQHGSSTVKPTSAVERTLAAIWSEVLGIEEVGVRDNFFEVGGDSLLIIRILSRLVKRGMRLSPDAFFAHPTISEQARLLQARYSAQPDAAVARSLPLTPIQHWFFDTIRTDRHHWNQSMLFATNVRPGRPELGRLVEQLLARHDALRTSFREHDGEWQAKIEEPGGELPLRIVDGTGDELIEAVATELNTSFDLAIAPLLRFAWFDGGNRAESRLLIVAHHLVIDAVSWQILLDDLNELLRRVAEGRDAALPPRPTSISVWASHLEKMAQDAMSQAERQFWRDYVVDVTGTATVGEAVDTEGDCRSISACLDAATSASLQRHALSSLHASLNEVLVSAMARVIASRRKSAVVVFDMEGHGREPGRSGPDVTGTVGWLTSLFPVCLRAERPEDWQDPVAALVIVKERLHALPRRGLGYGLLRYLANEVQAPQPEFLFNFLGRVEGAGEADGTLRLLRRNCGPARSPRCERPYAVEVNASIVGGAVQTTWTFNPSRFEDGAVERAAADFNAALAALVDAAGEDGRSAIVPSDFPLAGLSRQELDRLSAQLGDLDDD